MKQVEVTKIIVKINDKEIQLAPAEARELQRVLDDTLGAQRGKDKPIIVPCPVSYTYSYPRTYPYWEVIWVGGNTDSTGGKLPAREVTYSLARAYV